jgi:L-arabinose isomerase
VPEIANVLTRAGLPFAQVTGVLEEQDPCWDEVDQWVQAARVTSVLQHHRMGLLGRYYNGMQDIYTDLTLQTAVFGGHFEMLEPDALAELRCAVTDAAVQDRVALFGTEFDVQADCDPAELGRAARTSLALDALVQRHRLGSLAYYHESVPGHSNEDLASSMILGCSMLTSHGVPVAGEYEVKNALAMKILDAFGAGGSFTEFYALDHDADVVLMGHDGPGHVRIASGRTKVRPLQVFHGKVGRGLGIEMSVRHGPVTLLSVVQGPGGKVFLLCAQGLSVPGPILEIGNTNSRYRFAPGARQFVADWNRHGPAHHCAVGVGHLAASLEKLGALLRIEVHQVC